MSIYTLSKRSPLVYIKRVEERRAERHRLNHHHQPSLVNRQAELNEKPMVKVCNERLPNALHSAILKEWKRGSPLNLHPLLSLVAFIHGELRVALLPGTVLL